MANVLQRRAAQDPVPQRFNDLVPFPNGGDLDALESIYRAFRAPVYSLGRRICGNEEDAEDVLQETFLEVCRSIARYRGDGSLWGWVRQVAVSKALMLLRRERNRPGRSVGDESLAPDALGKAPPEPSAPIDLETALSKLSPVARAVLWLHDVEGYTLAEIAEITGIPHGTLKSRRHRARTRLQVLLDEGPASAVSTSEDNRGEENDALQPVPAKLGSIS